MESDGFIIFMDFMTNGKWEKLSKSILNVTAHFVTNHLFRHYFEQDLYIIILNDFNQKLLTDLTALSFFVEE